ncbi:hypothetical protein [Pseudolysinimonas yzui]|uniref:DUF4199 domain-containing protein n=1 Tax=Pseudolysinimonas yzui TaxID=2708254 RepID=A0A8J3LZM6_9MICO|nr:hypothetical protein [Pseudolysinimonas yzui]GHF10532.1 hypothetical protein GCM10011600_09600 [Pseudolysinimonas yzui]
MSGETSAHEPSAGNDPTESVADAVVTPPSEPTPQLPPENLVRGLLLSLLVVPAGILVFVLIWNLGFIASIVGFGVAFAAFFLYRLGSGGRVSMRGAVVVALVTVATLVLAFLAAEVFTLAGEIARVNHVSVPEVLTSPELSSILWRAFSSPEVAGALAGDAVMTLIFGAIGCFTVLRGAFREAKAAPLAG